MRSSSSASASMLRVQPEHTHALELERDASELPGCRRAARSACARWRRCASGCRARPARRRGGVALVEDLGVRLAALTGARWIAFSIFLRHVEGARSGSRRSDGFESGFVPRLHRDRDVLRDPRELLGHAVPAREHHVLAGLEDRPMRRLLTHGRAPSPNDQAGHRTSASRLRRGSRARPAIAPHQRATSCDSRVRSEGDRAPKARQEEKPRRRRSAPERRALALAARQVARCPPEERSRIASRSTTASSPPARVGEVLLDGQVRKRTPSWGQPARRSQAGRRSTRPASWPSAFTVPTARRSRPAITRRSVVFPDPEGPAIPTTRSLAVSETRTRRPGSPSSRSSSSIEVEAAALVAVERLEPRERRQRERDARGEKRAHLRVAARRVEQRVHGEGNRARAALHVAGEDDRGPELAEAARGTRAPCRRRSGERERA